MQRRLEETLLTNEIQRFSDCHAVRCGTPPSYLSAVQTLLTSRVLPLSILAYRLTRVRSAVALGQPAPLAE
jgi:hypothetical protein